MADKKTIGTLLIIGALAILLLPASAFGGVKGVIDDVFGSDGKKVECDANIDKDSIHTASCNVVGECKAVGLTAAPLGFFGDIFDIYNDLTDNERHLGIFTGGELRGGNDFEVSLLGVNKGVSAVACVDLDANTVRLKLASSAGVVAEMGGVTI